MFAVDKSVVTELGTVDVKSASNELLWSPKGRLLVVASMKNNQGEFEIYDAEDLPLAPLGTAMHMNATHYEWDPSGRFLLTGVSNWVTKGDNGYMIWDFKGT